MSDWFPKEPNVGYETLIYDVMTGDQTLFMRADMVEQAGASCSRCSTPGLRIAGGTVSLHGGKRRTD